MVILVYGQNFDNEHEWEQFREVRSLLTAAYEKSDKTIYVLFNFVLQSNQIDMAILTEEGPIIVELKDYTGVITGGENGAWSVKTPTGEVLIKNVFLQAKRQKFALIDKLKELREKGILEIKNEEQLYNVECCGLFNKGSTYDRSQLSPNARKWFSIITKEELIEKLSFANSGYSLSSTDMQKITSSINLTQTQVLNKDEPRQVEARQVLEWEKALGKYLYAVNLAKYKDAKNFPKYFKLSLVGDKDSTRQFQDYFREHASSEIEVYFEVMYWKMFSVIAWKAEASENLQRMIHNMVNSKVEPKLLFSKIKHFTENVTPDNLKNFRNLLGMKPHVEEEGTLSLASVFPAFINPNDFPIVDICVAYWVNFNLNKQNVGRISERALVPFNLVYRGKPTRSILDNEFESYRHWILWCQDTAKKLTKKTGNHWGARDVEMAVYAAETKSPRTFLEVL